MNRKTKKEFRSPSTEDDERVHKRRKICESKLKLSKETTEIERRNKELQEENAKLGDDLARVTYLAAENRSRRKAVEKKLDLQSIELEKARAEIDELVQQRKSFFEENKELRSKAKRVDRLEKDLESLRATNSHEDIAVTQKLYGIAESLRNKVTSLKEKCQLLNSKVEEYESIRPGVKPVVLRDEYHHLVQENKDVKAELDVLRRERDELQKLHVEGIEKATKKGRKTGKSSSDRNSSTSDSDVEDESSSKAKKQKLLVTFAGYPALVSHANYFKFDWKKYYTFSCSKCPKKVSSRRDMKDHIWCEHYGGSFTCFYCKGSSKNYTFAHSFEYHMKMKHSNTP